MLQRILAKVVIVTLICSGGPTWFPILDAPGAQAAQPWTCICKGERKRFLASTRHCEFRMGVPKGEWCSKNQWKSVYGPACKREGCKLPPLR